MIQKSEKPSRYNLSFSNLIKPETIKGLTIIGVVNIVLCAALAYTSGVLTPEILTKEAIIDRFEKNGGLHEGFRRNHAKGVCVTGIFKGSGEGSEFSSATVFTKVKTPVFGRFSLAEPNPFQSDKSAQVRSMALNFTMADGQVWRTAMNNIPVFAVQNVEGFYDLMQASRRDPDTGKPDPDMMKAFFTKYPASAKSIPMIKSRSISSGFSNSTYNGINAFIFVTEQGSETAVRWSMKPIDPFIEADKSAKLRKNQLFDDLIKRIAREPVQWKMIATIAEAGDPVNDATQAWPQSRRQVELGTLTLAQIDDEMQGPCQDINFDPLILPNGIKASNDPLLSARSSTYAESFSRRENEPKSDSAISIPKIIRTEGKTSK